MLSVFFTLFFLRHTDATILSDTGCTCALVKNGVTTPNASATAVVGCSSKQDWTGTGQASKWCLTDQTFGSCGTLQPSFGYVDTCSIAGFTSMNLSETMMYTGQNLTVSWLSQNILPDEWIKISYQGANITKGIGANVTFGNYTSLLTTATAASGSPVLLSTVSSPEVSLNSSDSLVVLQSRLSGPQVLYNGSAITGNLLCDGRNISISWFAVGQAAIGTTTVTVASSGGGGGGGGPRIVGTPVIHQSVPGNNTVLYTLPRSFVPSGFGTTYVPTIVSSTYTLAAPGFGLSAAPSVSPTSTPTPTPSKTGTPSLSFGSTASTSVTSTPTTTPTPTPSLSFGSTASVTPSQSPTSSVTPTQTPSVSLSDTPTPTSSTTGTPTPTTTQSLNLIALNQAAAAAAANSLSITVGAAIGGVVALIVVAAVAYRIHDRRALTERRLQRMKTMAARMENAKEVYGQTGQTGQTVMYQVTMPQVIGGRPSQRVRDMRHKN